jgi:predicted ArsR family transcriptional regulator
LAKLAHVLRSTIKRTLKKLIQRKLVKVEWYTNNLGMSTKLYGLFEEEDRSLFLSCKRSLSPKELKEIEEDAGDPRFL